MTTESELDGLLEFISGTGKYEHFGRGMFTYPDSEDADDRRKHEMCLELERQGKIQKHLVVAGRIAWMPTEPKDRKK